MLNINQIKNKIKHSIVEKLSPINNIVSLTFVGSFETSTDLALISDIDIIVIVDQLTEPIFNKIKNETNKIQGDDIGLNGYQIKLNMSFGPLKFNEEKIVVFHLMVYDVAGHRKHVIESPFTCLDWECFSATLGKNLGEIYTAKGVQLSDLIGSRRGLEAYLDDLKKQTISFREYDFSTVPITEKKLFYSMDVRHQKEYAYHIIKFLQLNLLKILHQTNERFAVSEIADSFEKLHPSFFNHAILLKELHAWKYDKGIEPSAIFKRLDQFINDLSIWLQSLNLSTTTFFRHGKTALNDGSFLGKRRNPSIITPLIIEDNKLYNKVFTGTLMRTIETGQLLNSNQYFKDPNLDEIDYGDVEGLTIDDLKNQFPNLLAAWERKEDPRFPNGENQEDVANRLNFFLDQGFNEMNSAVVTHNVVIRALLGQTYKLPVHEWYKLNPAHTIPHNYHVYEKTLIPDFPKDLQIQYKDQIVDYQESLTQYGIFWIPGKALLEYTQQAKSVFALIEPNAPYLHHPVHLTIFLFTTQPNNELAITRTINPPKINMEVGNWFVFEKDAATGGDTLSIAIKKTTSLANFQIEIANQLKTFSTKPVFYKNQWSGVFQESYKQYGFPFVGEHWIPHITIASALSNGKELIDTLSRKKIGIADSNDGYWALYEINKDQHICKHIWEINK